MCVSDMHRAASSKAPTGVGHTAPAHTDGSPAWRAAGAAGGSPGGSWPGSPQSRSRCAAGAAGSTSAQTCIARLPA